MDENIPRLNLQQQLSRVKMIAGYSKWGRLRHHPVRYAGAMLFKSFVYPVLKKGIRVQTPLFFGKQVNIELPSSTDIYLTGGKSHGSEIRLAEFMIRTLREGDHFLDIGAHIGYFTLLANELLGDDGRIEAFEPAKESFALLQQNTVSCLSIRIHQYAVSDNTEALVFYEFPSMYAEYNTRDISQFNDASWIASFPPQKVSVSCTTIDMMTANGDFHPSVIKIDVEGGEYQVVRGGTNYLANNSPTVVMEYVSGKRTNTAHVLAIDLLRSHAYLPHIITAGGQSPWRI